MAAHEAAHYSASSITWLHVLNYNPALLHTMIYVVLVTIAILLSSSNICGAYANVPEYENEHMVADDHHVITIAVDGRIISDNNSTKSERTDGNKAASGHASSLRMKLSRRLPAEVGTSETLRRAIKKGRHRLDALLARPAKSSHTYWSAAADSPSALNLESTDDTLYASEEDAIGLEFLTTIQIGSPPQNVTAIIDTGSDLVWTQCQPCEHCFRQPQALFNPSESTTFTPLSCVNNTFCTFLNDGSGGANSSCNAHRECSYSYAYADFSQTNGVVASDTLTLGSHITYPNLVFGCGQNNGPDNSFTNSSGIIGLGQGLISLTTQLGASIDHKFSYCLVPWDSPPTVLGTLSFGANSKNSYESTSSTPLITNILHESYYYVSLQGVSIGGKLLNIPHNTFDILPDGRGGLIVDSGTPITYLKDLVYKVILDTFTSSLVKLDKNVTQSDFDLCYLIPTSTFTVPTFTFHFENLDLHLPPENYFIKVDNNICLAMASSGGYTSILGSIQQQNFEFGFDVKAKTLYMKLTTCGLP